jgi:plastocyanin
MRPSLGGLFRGSFGRFKGAGAIFAGVALALVLCVQFSFEPQAAADPAAVVTMSDAPPKFVPEKVSVKVGQTVEWKNTGRTIHDVTSKAGPMVKADQVAVPAGAQAFDSGFLAPGKSFSYTFTVPGTYRYICIPHQADGMMGEVEVTK